MKCPYCGGKMESGSIIAEDSPGLVFMPEGVSYGIFKTQKGIEKKGGIVLDGLYHIRGSQDYPSVGCNVCRDCRKIIIEY